MPLSIQYRVRNNLFEKYPKIETCLKCNTCALVCPVTRYGVGFSPTNTFISNVFSAPEPENNPNIWLCVSCHKCEEICPYEVKPLEVIEALKEEAFEKGYTPEAVRKEIEQVLTTGYAFPILQSLGAINRERARRGLQVLGERKFEEIKKIARKTGLENKMSGKKEK